VQNIGMMRWTPSIRGAKEVAKKYLDHQSRFSSPLKQAEAKSREQLREQIQLWKSNGISLAVSHATSNPGLIYRFNGYPIQMKSSGMNPLDRLTSQPSNLLTQFVQHFAGFDTLTPSNVRLLDLE
jgi:hypothetical protein